MHTWRCGATAGVHGAYLVAQRVHGEPTHSQAIHGAAGNVAARAGARPRREDRGLRMIHALRTLSTSDRYLSCISSVCVLILCALRRVSKTRKTSPSRRSHLVLENKGLGGGRRASHVAPYPAPLGTEAKDGHPCDKCCIQSTTVPNVHNVLLCRTPPAASIQTLQPPSAHRNRPPCPAGRRL